MNYFRGWYFKCQNGERTLAVIPAVHKSGKDRSCSVQLITDDGSWTFNYPYEEYIESKEIFKVSVGKSVFDKSRLMLNLENSDCTAAGEVKFSELTPIRYDIMGPFKYVPFMECRHSVISMRHFVDGEITVNGEKYRFDNAVGYIEGDRGRSFPKEYVWTQCSFDGGSLMLSAADIPILGIHFTGIIAVILWRGMEYRLATYLGARAVKIGDGQITVKQGNMALTAKLIEKKPHPLSAPSCGAMTRTIHESASCMAQYSFEIGGRAIFQFQSRMASFEYEYKK